MAAFQYFSFELKRGRDALSSFVAHMRGLASAPIGEGSARIVGIFAPQLGFASNEITLLLEGTIEARQLSHASVVDVREERLSPTVRPLKDQRLRNGGIYVHRWFTIDGQRLLDFIELSNRAWSGFEASYDTEIFGLFTAAESDSDRTDKARRLLLLTWYRDHGVWEASREPSRDATSLFAQRHLLTRTTIGRSSLRLV